MHSMIAWFTRNHVAANLLLVSIIGAGLFSMTNRVPLEVFPSIDLDVVNITVVYRGATPAEAEESVTVRIEEAIHDLEGIEKLRSRSVEGFSMVTVEVASGYDSRELMNDIKSRVDAINTLPTDAERPVVATRQHTREVISVVASGDLSEMELRLLGERVRDDLVRLPGISQVELEGVRPYEISIEVDERTLQEFGVTLEQVADRVRNSSLDLSAGNIRARSGEVLVRTKGQAYTQREFEEIVILTRSDGTLLRLSDIARVHDSFDEDLIVNEFNGRPAVIVEVYRIGDQSAIEVANAVKQYITDTASSLPEGVELGYWRDRSKIVKARLKTLSDSAIQGGILVILLLSLFLRPALALWVFIGIPVSFLGAFIIMPLAGVTLNIISLFAFILVLGIVVDDAIVTGENVYTHLQRSENPLHAAIEGTQEVSVPVTFGILTTVAAFVPLLMIGGPRGAIFAQIPLIVVPVLLFSLIESKFVLPAHLKNIKPPSAREGRFSQLQTGIARGLEDGIRRYYAPVLERTLNHRYLSLAIICGFTAIVLAMVLSGWTRFIFFPKVQSETARASLTMPAGTPFEITDQHIQRIARAAQALQAQYIDPDTGESVITEILSTTGSTGGSDSGQSNIGRVMFEITAPEHRTLDVTSSQLVNQWRKDIGNIAGLESLTLRAEIGRSSDPVDIQLYGNDFIELREVASRLRQHLSTFPDLFDIQDSLSNGKEELQLGIKPEAELLGLTLNDLARQVRAAFFGFEIQRIQRGRDDVRVMVRFPASQRESLDSLHTMFIRTPQGAEVPFSEVAQISPGRSPTAINRLNRQRVVNVTADANKETADIEAIKRDLHRFMADLKLLHPAIGYSLEGEAREQADSFDRLGWGLMGVLFVVYALLAIPFRSYLQPLIVMSVIPFGLVGAIIGHWIMDMSLTIMSFMGMLALTGVVINDSLVLVDYTNQQREKGISLHQAIRSAGVARFRPVLLTSLTTFCGLMPLIFEKSTQAQFLIPMAISLGFGILFATLITLLIIPVNYLILEDLRGHKEPAQGNALPHSG
ncbi:efflux RND transporter permease subunit [Aestuariirhabdus sp. Z084]|uniref:efflux RND transporter permease subunit n=1 Tax=Aestuariirhabdus haliotis TaxID=2918751 RepID=UPI00201B37E6|nr:efflux RND transporter permease subunit [Aestuariirhabdus haliotis]MCL6416149.1 efflux RND transporter permease subunit [Aestuariirhabdus haliotis]MCL6420094.1 efflux RND transporter permease subunit [Aestuariirhabdus haliotis]